MFLRPAAGFSFMKFGVMAEGVKAGRFWITQATRPATAATPKSGRHRCATVDIQLLIRPPIVSASTSGFEVRSIVSWKVWRICCHMAGAAMAMVAKAPRSTSVELTSVLRATWPLFFASASRLGLGFSVRSPAMCSSGDGRPDRTREPAVLAGTCASYRHGVRLA